MTFRDELREALSETERAILPRAFDIIGDIAILDLPAELTPKAGVIASALMRQHKHVTTVLQKDAHHGGEYRTQGLRFLAGVDTRETLVRESGVQLLLDVAEVYFSPRSSTERLRIAGLVQPGERVLVMFSGAAPFVCVIAKHAAARLVVGVEKNPVGHQYATENVRRNKLRTAQVYEGDCTDLSFLSERFDRILLPLPASSERFIASALHVAASPCTLHIYKFGQEHELPELTALLTQACADAGWHVERMTPVKAGRPAPFSYRWCFDTLVHRK